MTIDFPDGVARRLHARWRCKLEEARRRYSNDQTEETRAEYLKMLQVFTDLIIRGKLPSE